MLGRYTTKRSTRRWPLAFFYNILDIACLAAYILYYENNKLLSKKSYERRLFYRQLGRELCTPFVENRSHNAQIMRHFTTKVAIESFFGRAINPYAQPTASKSSKPQAQFDSTGRKKITGVCHVCLQSEFKKRRKTRKSCSLGMSNAVKEVCFIRNIFEELELNCDSISIYNDNQAAQHIVANEFVTETYETYSVEQGIVIIQYQPTDQLMADIMTKPLCKDKHENYVKLMNVYDNNKLLSKKSYERRLFYRQLGRELCTPFVENRSHNAQIMRHFTTKVAIESFFGRAINPYAQPTASKSSKPQAQFDSTGRKKITGVCHVCLQSEFKKRRKTRKSCSVCEFPICDEHCVSTTTCEECAK
ncbi:hypothetical protein J437_LFUL014062 [Ladona fulva]|uniref:PiggyBac transposable element-derived protein domain-containing protein n=1 Tax=Ladona fulva TaxID=123851 RepID=A0A8K0KMR6_LADFU|nr:hypothetical protein J437_LFUL014062 [Ladona fulva]